MDSVFSFVVHKEMCVLESTVNGTNTCLGCSGSHYHFTEKEDRAPVTFAGGLTLRRFDTELGHCCP